METKGSTHEKKRKRKEKKNYVGSVSTPYIKSRKRKHMSVLYGTREGFACVDSGTEERVCVLVFIAALDWACMKRNIPPHSL